MLKWDLATILGLVTGFILVISAIAYGGSALAFVDFPAALIVLGGTFAITAVSFSVEEVISAQSIMAKTVLTESHDAHEAAMTVMTLSEKSRREGLLSLEDVLQREDHAPFLSKALGMAIDGTPAEEVERVLRRDINAMLQRHRHSASVFRKAAEVAPAMGLIGTLIGLVKMLANLNDPSSIGPAMAVALLTTFYGAILATMVFSPLANKLERNSDEEALVQNVYMTAVSSICRQENPRRLELMLNAILPPKYRIRFFD